MYAKRVSDIRDKLDSISEELDLLNPIYLDHVHHFDEIENRTVKNEIIVRKPHSKTVYRLLSEFDIIGELVDYNGEEFFIGRFTYLPYCDDTIMPCRPFDFKFDLKWKDVNNEEGEDMTDMVKHGSMTLKNRYGKEVNHSYDIGMRYVKEQNNIWKIEVMFDNKLIHTTFIRSNTVRYAISKGIRACKLVTELEFWKQNLYTKPHEIGVVA